MVSVTTISKRDVVISTQWVITSFWFWWHDWKFMFSISLDFLVLIVEFVINNLLSGEQHVDKILLAGHFACSQVLQLRDSKFYFPSPIWSQQTSWKEFYWPASPGYLSFLVFLGWHATIKMYNTTERAAFQITDKTYVISDLDMYKSDQHKLYCATLSIIVAIWLVSSDEFNTTFLQVEQAGNVPVLYWQGKFLLNSTRLCSNPSTTFRHLFQTTFCIKEACPQSFSYGPVRR